MNEKKCTLKIKYDINNIKYKSIKKRKGNKPNILNIIFDFKKIKFKDKSIFVFGKNSFLLLTIIPFGIAIAICSYFASLYAGAANEMRVLARKINNLSNRQALNMNEEFKQNIIDRYNEWNDLNSKCSFLVL